LLARRVLVLVMLVVAVTVFALDRFMSVVAIVPRSQPAIRTGNDQLRRHGLASHEDRKDGTHEKCSPVSRTPTGRLRQRK
jgi:hypothetical protein